MNNKNVAVIMSVYLKDNPEFFDLSLASILDQSYGYKNIRIYLAIDGPISPEIETIVKKYTSHIFRVKRIKQNTGLANALNLLINSLTDEDLVFRMDSDDIAKKDRFERQVSFMNENEEVGIVGMGIEEFDAYGHRIMRVYPQHHNQIRKKMPLASPFAHPTVCFRRKALNILEGYSTRYHLCEDIEMWFRAIRMGIIMANLPDIGLEYRIQPDFYKRRSLSKAISEFCVYWRGTYEQFGINYLLAFPVLRFLTRLLPPLLIKTLYQHPMRTRYLNEQELVTEESYI